MTMVTLWTKRSGVPSTGHNACGILEKYFLNELMDKLTFLSSVHSNKVLNLHMADSGRLEMTKKADFEAR